jgi:hypothetical protein
LRQTSPSRENRSGGAQKQSINQLNVGQRPFWAKIPTAWIKKKQTLDRLWHEKKEKC